MLAGPLAPGTSAQLTLTLRVLSSALPGELINLAEISAAQDANGQPVPSIRDRDSDPDGNSANDPQVDDAIDNTGGDEDDADPALVMIPVPPIPALDLRALGLLALLMLAFGLRRLR